MHMGHVISCSNPARISRIVRLSFKSGSAFSASVLEFGLTGDDVMRSVLRGVCAGMSLPIVLGRIGVLGNVGSDSDVNIHKSSDVLMPLQTQRCFAMIETALRRLGRCL